MFAVFERVILVRHIFGWLDIFFLTPKMGLKRTNCRLRITEMVGSDFCAMVLRVSRLVRVEKRVGIQVICELCLD